MPNSILKIDKFEGGINSNADPKDIDNSEVADAVDAYFGTIGQVSTIGNAEHTTDLDDVGNSTVTAGYGLASFQTGYSITQLVSAHSSWSSPTTTEGTNGIDPFFTITLSDFSGTDNSSFNTMVFCNRNRSSKLQEWIDITGNSSQEEVISLDPWACVDNWGIRIHIGSDPYGTPDISYPIDGDSTQEVTISTRDAGNKTFTYNILTANDEAGVSKKWIKMLPDLPSNVTDSNMLNISSQDIVDLGWASSDYIPQNMYFFQQNPQLHTAEFFQGTQNSQISTPTGYSQNGRSNLLMVLAGILNQHQHTTATLNGDDGEFLSIDVSISSEQFSGDYTPSNKYIWVEYRHYGNNLETIGESCSFPVVSMSLNEPFPVGLGNSSEQSNTHSLALYFFQQYDCNFDTGLPDNGGYWDMNFLSIPQKFDTNHFAYGNDSRQIVENYTNNAHVTNLITTGWINTAGQDMHHLFDKVNGIKRQHATRRVMPGRDLTHFVWQSTLQNTAGTNAATSGETYKVAITGPNIDEEFIASQAYAADANDTFTEIVATLAGQIGETVSGTDLVSEGDMAGADDGNPWTTNTGWAIGSGVATCSAGDTTLEQTMSGGTWSASTYYQVKFDVSITSGTLYVDLGDNTGGNKKTIVTSGANRYEYIRTPDTLSGNLLRFYGGSFRGTVDNVSVKKVTAGIPGVSASVPSGAILKIETTQLGQAQSYQIRPSITRALNTPVVAQRTEVLLLVDGNSDMYCADTSSTIWLDLLNNNNSHTVIASFAAGTSGASVDTEITTSSNHGLSNDDVVSVKGTTNYDGIYKIDAVDSTTTFDIEKPYVAETADSAMTITKLNIESVNSRSTLSWTQSGAKLQTYANNGVLRLSDSNFDNAHNKSSWLGHINKPNLFNQTGTGTTKSSLAGWYVKDQKQKFANNPTDWIAADWRYESEAATSVHIGNLLSGAQKTFLGDALETSDVMLDFGGNNGDGTTTLIDSDGFAQTNASFAVSSGTGLLTNTASAQGIVTLPLTTVAGKSYQVRFDVTAQTNSHVNVSLGSTAAYNSSNKFTTSGTGNNFILDVPYVADDTTSFLAIQMTTSTSGATVNLDNIEVYEEVVHGKGGMKICILPISGSGVSWNAEWTNTNYKFYVCARFDDGTETQPSETDVDGLVAKFGSDYYIENSGADKFYVSAKVEPIDSNGHYVFDERMTGFVIYFSKEDEGYGEKYEFGYIDFKDGWKPADGGTIKQWVSLGTSSDSYAAQLDTYDAAYNWSILAKEYIGATFDLNNNYSYRNDTLPDVRWKCATVIGNRAFVGNVIYDDGFGEQYYPSRMIGSIPTQVDNFVIPSGILEFVTNDGDEIIQLENFSDRILQFKRNSLFIINVSTFGDEFMEEEHRWKGVSNPHHVVWTPEGVIWANEYSVYIYDGRDVRDLMLATQGAFKENRSISRDNWSNFFSDNSTLIFEPKSNQIIIKRSDTGSADLNSGDIYLHDLDNGGWTFGKGRFITKSASDNPKQTNAVTLADGRVYMLSSVEADDSFFSNAGNRNEGGLPKEDIPV